MIGLFELLLKVEKNSGMYLGRQSVSDLFMFLAGYEFVRSQINEEITQAEEDFYNEFQPWLQQKLGVRSLTSWAKLIMLSCHDEKTGFEMFFKFLREFQVRDQILRQLNRAEKLHVMQCLVSDLAQDESDLLRKDMSYPIWSPYDAFEAADTMLKVLASEKNTHA